MNKLLTDKQNQVLKFIARTIWRQKRPPTIREIAQNFKLSSTGTVRDYLNALQDKGYIKLGKRKARAIELTRQNFWQIPILAQVQAGNPVLTYENIEGYLDVQRLAFGDEQTFALRVKGDSMIEAGIMPEDLVLVRRQSSCNNGDVVVAWVDGEITIKYFKQCKAKIYLEPANQNYQPITPKESFSIIGKVISVVRKYV